MTTVRYIKAPMPPEPKTTKPARGKKRDTMAWWHRNNMNLVPAWVGIPVAGVASASGAWGPDPLFMAWAPLGLAVAGAMERTDVLLKTLDRQIERRYAGAVAASAGAWMTWATWMGETPGLLHLATLVPATVALGAPWWWHRRIRGKLRVEYDDALWADHKARREAKRMVLRLRNSWTTAMHNAGTPNVALAGIAASSGRVELKVRLPGNLSREDFKRKMGAAASRLETALNLRKGAARVVEPEAVSGRPGGKNAAKARDLLIRVMYADPFDTRDPLDPVDHRGRAKIGKTEVGEAILVDMSRSILVAGQTGSGKTGLVHNMIRAVTEIPWMAAVGIDAQPGAVEFGPWEAAMVALGRNVGDAGLILDALQREADRRAGIMSANGWRNWPCTAEDPHLVTFIDEFQKLTRAGLGPRVADMSRELRKYGMSFVIATQYPTKDAGLPPEVKEQMFYSIGLRVKSNVADRAIFGEDAKDAGWVPSKLPSDKPGYFYIEGGEHTHPIICLTDDLPDKVLDQLQKNAPEVVQVLGAAATGQELALMVDPLEGVPAPMSAHAEDDVVEAEVIPDPTNTKERVWFAVRTAPGDGVIHRKDIQKVAAVPGREELNQKSTDEYLAELMEEGLVLRAHPIKALYRKA